MTFPEFYRLRNHPLLPPGDDASGPFLFPHYRIAGYEIFCIAASGMGWEHVSVTVVPIKTKLATRNPTWEEMCWVKDQFWDKEACVIQYHPPESEYVSQHSFCLHLWRPSEVEFPRPDPLMVGIKTPK